MDDPTRIADANAKPAQAGAALPALAHLPPEVRSGSIALLALLALAYTLHWASEVFIPLLLGVLFSYALSPLVDGLQRWRVRRAIGAAGLLPSVLGGIGGAGYSLLDDAAALVQSLADAAQKLRDSLHALPGAPEGVNGKVQRAALKLEQAADESRSAPPAAGRGVTRVQVERRHFDLKDYLWSGTLGLAGFVGQATIVGVIAFFLMASGDSFRRKMARIAGPTFARRKITVRLLDEITAQIRRYLLVQVYTGVGVGVATWVAFRWTGLEHAAVWGVAAGILNFVPYLGSLAVSAGTALVGFLQFGTPAQTLTVGLASLAIHTLSGNLVAPWLSGRASRMNPVAVFVGVLDWGWLWGVWGLLLGGPLLMAIEAVCDRVDSLLPIGELLGE